MISRRSIVDCAMVAKVLVDGGVAGEVLGGGYVLGGCGLEGPVAEGGLVREAFGGACWVGLNVGNGH